MTPTSTRDKGMQYVRELSNEAEGRLGGRCWVSPSSGATWWQKADVECRGNALAGFHIEAKRRERVNLEEAYGQALRGARPGKVPIVVTRKTRDMSMVYLRWCDFLDILEQLQGGPP